MRRIWIDSPHVLIKPRPTACGTCAACRLFHFNSRFSWSCCSVTSLSASDSTFLNFRLPSLSSFHSLGSDNPKTFMVCWGDKKSYKFRAFSRVKVKGSTFHSGRRFQCIPAVGRTRDLWFFVLVGRVGNGKEYNPPVWSEHGQIRISSFSKEKWKTLPFLSFCFLWNLFDGIKPIDLVVNSPEELKILAWRKLSHRQSRQLEVF